MLVLLIGVATGSAYYVTQKKAKTISSEFPSKQVPIVRGEIVSNLSEGSLPMTPENAPFNASEDPAVKERGRFGYIKSAVTDLETGVITVMFDEALWLTGAQAEAAARKDLRCGTSDASDTCTLPSVLSNPYYISNPIKKDHKLMLAEEPQIKLVTQSDSPDSAGIKVSKIQELQMLLQKDEELRKENSTYYTPFWIEESNGVIKYIEQQYIP